MSLEYIYVTRHGVSWAEATTKEMRLELTGEFRSNWVVDPATGNYTANFPTPTGIAADPALTSHGVDQARQLAAHLTRRDGDGRGGRPLPLPVERIYCSPYYRCLETIRPFVEAVQDAEAEGGLMESRSLLPASSFAPKRRPWWAVRCDPGLVDWFGPAPFEQPQPAPVAELRKRFFPWIDAEYEQQHQHSGAVPLRHGESMAQLHARVAAALTHIIRECDRDGIRAIVICSHAAPIIAMGRALTGCVPFAVETEDFGTFTCGLSSFQRRSASARRAAPRTAGPRCFNGLNPRHVLPWDDQYETLRHEPWTGGRGICGGWDCEENCNCSFLADGEERGWRFSGDDEAFASQKRKSHQGPMIDSGLELGAVVQGRSTGQKRLLQGGQDASSGKGTGTGKTKANDDASSSRKTTEDDKGRDTRRDAAAGGVHDDDNNNNRAHDQHESNSREASADDGTGGAKAHDSQDSHGHASSHGHSHGSNNNNKDVTGKDGQDAANGDNAASATNRADSAESNSSNGGGGAGGSGGGEGGDGRGAAGGSTGPTHDAEQGHDHNRAIKPKL